MENSLGLDVHGANESQGQGQPRSTAQSWGILADTAQQDGSKKDTVTSWGSTAEISWGPPEGENSWGPTEGENSWGPTEGENSRGPTERGNSWGPTEGENNWGLAEGANSWGPAEGENSRRSAAAENSRGPPKAANTASKHDRSKKNKGDSRATLDEEGKASPTPKEDGSKKDKGTPYVPAAPPTRAKMSPDELAERMEKIRLQNEKIKERREHVKADEEAFNTSVATDRARQAANRKVQAEIDQNREQNAKKKLEKMGNREWDSGKQGGEWKQNSRGRGRSSFGLSKDRGREPSSANPRKVINDSLPAVNDSNTSHDREERPQTTSQVTTEPSHSLVGTQGVDIQGWD